jgi:hypothetical protein
MRTEFETQYDILPIYSPPEIIKNKIDERGKDGYQLISLIPNYMTFNTVKDGVYKEEFTLLVFQKGFIYDT